VGTGVALGAITDAARALGLNASAFGSSACRRGGATFRLLDGPVRQPRVEEKLLKGGGHLARDEQHL